ncbi:DegV family protein [Tepidiforma sp.]|uniref:DegV family protein n=1 Tax=Tepidiforma sp. TaxID=2682230 RepID=UPI002ADE5367|nr:DegV family protein [Tepidiforma sp.]
MNRTVLLTDTATCLGREAALELGVGLVAGSFSIRDERQGDDERAWRAAYERLRSGCELPRTFAPPERAFVEAMTGPARAGQPVLCLVTPFDVSPSFTTASAAVLSVQDELPESRIKVVNPGIGHAGLGALLASLAGMAAAGASLDALLDAVEELGPACEAVVIPADTRWLEASGRLALVEERLGTLDEDIPLLRIGTRVTGLGRASSHEVALEAALGRLAGCAADGPVNAVVGHAAAPGLAEEAADRLRRKCAVDHLVVAELPMTIGAIVGPGALAIGAAPAPKGGTDA